MEKGGGMVDSVTVVATSVSWMKRSSVVNIEKEPLSVNGQFITPFRALKPQVSSSGLVTKGSYSASMDSMELGPTLAALDPPHRVAIISCMVACRIKSFYTRVFTFRLPTRMQTDSVPPPHP